MASITPVVPTPLVTAPAPAGDPRQQAFERALAGQLGKSMQGEVLARLADGSFAVRVAGTAARMQLPAGARPGAEVPLTLVALTPRPTFQVGPGAGAPATFTEAHAMPDGGDALVYTPGGAVAGRAGVGSAAAPDAAAAAAAARLAALADDASQASLSPAARAIGSVLAEAMKDGQPASALVGRTPLVATPGAEPPQLAAALQDAIGKSGMFYESHVAEWARGRMSLADLAVEPQMLAARDGRASGADPSGAQLVNLQLAAHEQSQLAWQGMAWPGQPLQLEIGRAPLERDAPRRERGSEPDDAAWQSRLRLRFALLGEVSASVTLAGAALHLKIETGAEPAGALLRAHAPRLSQALDAAGITLASLAIQSPEAGDG